ncbi:hypothetical protein SynA18461_00493 [Synechococcus sp. A18-46.1]|nr:hypothetical protein SynA18461_00493 [Synechococcus sp. A18-46.1]
MIEHKKGVCFIVDSEMSLLAVFTDGDFRRAFFESNNLSSIIFTLNALDTATLSPISFDLSTDLTLEDLISLFSIHDIYDIPITDNGKLISSVNIHSFKLSAYD